jgi:hypothetical protein
MTDPIPVLVAPSARDLTREYMIAQLETRGITAPWSTGIPAQRPAVFFVIEDLNTAEPYGPLAEAQMIQVRCYNADLKWLSSTMRLVKAVWKVMPVWVSPTTGVQAQEVEHAGGPSFDMDPAVPGLYYGQVISWVTVMTSLA